MIAAVLSRTPDSGDDREALAVGWAEALTSSTDPDPAAFDRFTPAELVELSGWVGLQNLYSRVNRALGLPPQGLSA